MVEQQENWLTQQEINETYLAIADWCNKHDKVIDAVAYSERAGDYERIVSILWSRAIRYPAETANYYIEVLERAPQSLCESQPMIQLLKVRAYLNNFKIEKAFEILKPLQEKYEKLPETPENKKVLGETYVVLGLLDLVVCYETNQYDFLYFFKRASELLPEGSTLIDKETQLFCGNYVCFVRKPIPGQFAKAVQAAKEVMPYITHVMQGCGYGMEPLAEAEFAYMQRDFKVAEKCIRQTILATQQKGQIDVECTAIFYMLKIDLAYGEVEEFEPLLARMKEVTEMGRDSFKMIADIFFSWFYVQTGQYEKISPWVLDYRLSKEMTSPISFALDHLVRAKYRYAKGDYYQMLAELEEHMEDAGLGGYLLGKIEVRILKAAAYYRLEEKENALEMLQQAYELADTNGLVMPFVEMGASMRTLAQFAQNSPQCTIPAEWLEDIKRKSSTYAKKLAYVGNYFNRFAKEDGPRLTKKELEMLKNICRGLTREEIAVECDLSINTVKSMMKILGSSLKQGI